MKLTTKNVALVAAGLLALTGCGATDDKATDSKTVVEEPEFDSETASKEVYDKISAGLPNGDLDEFLDNACDDEGYSWWSCYYDGLDVDPENRLNIHFKFPGGMDEDALADRGRHWFASNLGWTMDIEEKAPEITHIVSYNSQGLDLGTTFDSDFVKP